jgi:uncharacterized protein (TIGR02246 family)
MLASRPEDCDRLFAEAVNAGDLAAVLALYEEDGCFVQREGVAAGRAAIRTVIAEMLAKEPRLTCRVWKIVGCGEDLALLYNDWTLSMKGPDGSRLDRSGKALELVRRQPDGTWRFAIDDPYGRG